MLSEGPVGAGAGQAVEISEKNERHLGRTRGEPFFIEELRLEQAFASAQPEMRVDDVHRAERRFHVHRDRHAAFAAIKRSSAGQGTRLAKRKRIAAYDRVAVMLVASLHGGMKVAMPAELLGDQSRLIDSAGTRPAEIQLLQPNEIRLQLGDHLGDARFRALPVHPTTGMHVVGRHPQLR
jgi:hypothetical protein